MWIFGELFCAFKQVRSAYREAVWQPGTVMILPVQSNYWRLGPDQAGAQAKCRR